MAGHIDHGKTSLTKALTNVDTDRLKEEKERSISIELGFAPLTLKEGLEVSIIDVPGHERFIRQMIAGVAGIDLVLLVVAADEGVMPQTKEHLDILSLLGLKRGMIVVTKRDRVDDEMLELVEADIREEIQGTFLADEALHFVDSLSGFGIEALKDEIAKSLEDVEPRSAEGAFRLPIDQVFTVHGQGTVVRGTVYEGRISEGEILQVLPSGTTVRARQLQVHYQARKEARAGQRLAINVGGVSKEELSRGDVLVAPGHFESTTTVDIALTTVESLKYPLKQRGYIKLHLGTAEVYGKIVFFDRNELEGGAVEILCQLRLDEPVVTRRGDRFILRRPTPMETIGGGEIIDAHGERYRFGQETIAMLARKKEGTPVELVERVLLKEKLLTKAEIAQQTGLNEEAVQEALKKLSENSTLVNVTNQDVTTKAVVASLAASLSMELERYHDEHSLREGMKKAELIQMFGTSYPKKLLEWTLQHRQELFRQAGPFVALASHEAKPPSQWKKRVESVLMDVENDRFNVKPLEERLRKNQIPESLHLDLTHYFIRKGILFDLDEKLYVHRTSFMQELKKLFEQTNDSFTLQQAKEVTGLTRKYLVPFLEKLDELQLTIRQEGERKWREDYVKSWLN